MAINNTRQFGQKTGVAISIGKALKLNLEAANES